MQALCAAIKEESVVCFYCLATSGLKYGESMKRIQDRSGSPWNLQHYQQLALNTFWDNQSQTEPTE